MHPDVPVRVRSVEVREPTVHIELQLAYSKTRPVCCPEPACYQRCLTPRGLERLAQELREALGWLVPPSLELVVHPEFEPGYAFSEPIFTPSTTPMRFTHPE